MADTLITSVVNTPSSEIASKTFVAASYAPIAEPLSIRKDGSSTTSAKIPFAFGISTDGGIIGKITTVTNTYDILVTDETVICNKVTAFTVTLPVGVVGQKFTIKNIGAGTVTLEANGADVIDGDLNQPILQWDSIQVQCYAANAWGIV